MSDEKQVTDWISHYRAEMDAHKQAASTHFAKVTVPKLAKLGVRRIDIEYSGYGDSGGINSCGMYGDNDTPVQVDNDEIREEIGNYAYELMPPGFENNEGGEGVIKIDVVNGTYKLHHGQHIQETNWEESEGTF